VAAAGMSALLWSASARPHSRFVAGLFLFSFLALCPGAFFRPHYFILLLPVIAILIGVAVSSAADEVAEHFKPKRIVFTFIPILIFLVSFGYSIFNQREVYFSMNALDAFQETYGANVFVPAIEVAAYIEKHSPESARIAVLGSEPEIYFYAHRHSATGYLYMYSLIGHQKYLVRMREEMMHELEANHPDYLVYVDDDDSWGERANVPQAADFLAWVQRFRTENYEPVGVADILEQPEGAQTQYVWGHAAKTYVAQSSKVIYVLKRK